MRVGCGGAALDYVGGSGVYVTGANSEIRELDDTFFQMLSKTGGRPVISITEVTAAAIRVRVKFLPAGPT